MQILALTLVGLYAALNLFLAVAGNLVEPAAGATLVARAVPTATFALAGVVLTASLWLRTPWIARRGLILGSVAPMLYGAMVEGENVWLHHLVRALVAVVIMVVWLIAFRSR